MRNLKTFLIWSFIGGGISTSGLMIWLGLDGVTDGKSGDILFALAFIIGGSALLFGLIALAVSKVRGNSSG